jgi:hypothetical protein
MMRFVIGPDVALRLAREKPIVSSGHELLAPTLVRTRSQAAALVMPDERLAGEAGAWVAVAPYPALFDDARGT